MRFFTSAVALRAVGFSAASGLLSGMLFWGSPEFPMVGPGVIFGLLFAIGQGFYKPYGFGGVARVLGFALGATAAYCLAVVFTVIVTLPFSGPTPYPDGMTTANIAYTAGGLVAGFVGSVILAGLANWIGKAPFWLPSMLLTVGIGCAMGAVFTFLSFVSAYQGGRATTIAFVLWQVPVALSLAHSLQRQPSHARDADAPASV